MTEQHSELWRVRESVPLDEDMLVSMWLMSYCQTREGHAYGAEIRDGSEKGRAKRDAFWNLHRPVVMSLLEESTVMVVCDVEDPNVVYAWACYDGDTVHHAVVKRGVVRDLGDGEAKAMLRALLGERLEQSCAYTYYSRDLQRLGLLPRDATRAWYPSVGAIVDASQRVDRAAWAGAA